MSNIKSCTGAVKNLVLTNRLLTCIPVSVFIESKASGAIVICLDLNYFILTICIEASCLLS